MCAQCDEITKTIAQYQRLKGRITDSKMHEAAERMIAELEAKKLALHSGERPREGRLK